MRSFQCPRCLKRWRDERFPFRCPRCLRHLNIDSEGRISVPLTVEIERGATPSPNRIAAATEPACPLCGEAACDWGCEGGVAGW